MLRHKVVKSMGKALPTHTQGQAARYAARPVEASRASPLSPRWTRHHLGVGGIFYTKNMPLTPNNLGNDIVLYQQTYSLLHDVVP